MQAVVMTCAAPVAPVHLLPFVKQKGHPHRICAVLTIVGSQQQDSVAVVVEQPPEELPIQILGRPGAELRVCQLVEAVHFFQKLGGDLIAAEGFNRQILLGEFFPLPADVSALILVEAPEIVIEAFESWIFPDVALVLPGDEPQLLHHRQPLRIHVVEAEARHVVLAAQPVYGLDHDPAEQVFVLSRGDEESVPRYGSGRAHSHHLGIVGDSQAAGHVRPHVVPDELPFAVSLDVQGSGGYQIGTVPYGQVDGQPAGFRAHAPGGFHPVQPLPLEDRRFQGERQGVPSLLGDFGDVLDPL